MEAGEYVKLTRENSLLVRHSWSLVLYNTFQTGVDGGYTDLSLGAQVPEVVVEEVSDQPKDVNDVPEVKGALVVDEDAQSSRVSVERKERIPQAVPRVMDARTSTILGVLRQHFEEIPDFRNGFGVRINVCCTLRFQGEVLLRLQAEAAGKPTKADDDDETTSSWPALYAVVISFITTGLYGPIPSVHVPFLLSEPPQNNKAWQFPGTESPTSVFGEETPQKKSEGRSAASKGKTKTSSRDFADEFSDRRVLMIEPSKKVDDQHDLYTEMVILELEPRQPVPTLVDARIVFSDEDGRSVQGQLDSIPVGIEDLFQKPLLPETLPMHNVPEYLFALFKALFEACSGPGRLGTETFPLKNSSSHTGVSIEGSESVKLLEGQADRIVGAVEQWLGPFVVAVSGHALVSMVKDGGVLHHAVFLEDDFAFNGGATTSRDQGSHGWPGSRDKGAATMLRLEDSKDRAESTSSGYANVRAMGPELGNNKGGLGCFYVLIFLPPRYHLLLKMEVSDWSTLVRIRTDHWPCLAHVDEFLEALVMSR